MIPNTKCSPDPATPSNPDSDDQWVHRNDQRTSSIKTHTLYFQVDPLWRPPTRITCA